jgi:hypothetical protein
VPADLSAFADIARAAATNDRASVVAGLEAAPGDVDAIVATLLRLRLGRLVLATLGAADQPVAQALRAQFAPDGPLLTAAAAELLDAFAEARDALDRIGIAALLLKGAVLAEELYGGIDHRPQDDVDVLVHRADARRAGAALRALGYRRRRRDGHADTFQRGAVTIDLHRRLRATPAYRVDDGEAWRSRRRVTIAGVTAETLSEPLTFTLVAASLAEDVAYGMAKLKNACDAWLLVRRLDVSLDWASVDRVVLNGAALALLALDRMDDAPGLRDRAAEVVTRDRAHALALLNAPRGAPANLAWMGDVYPGRLLAFRLYPVVVGLPWTLRDIRLHRSRP